MVVYKLDGEVTKEDLEKLIDSMLPEEEKKKLENQEKNNLNSTKEE